MSKSSASALIVSLLVLVWMGCGDSVVGPVTDPDSTINVVDGCWFDIVVSSNPTTGYHWLLREPLDTQRLRLIATEYVGDPNPDGKAGVGGCEQWLFRALSTGSTVVCLGYAPFGDSTAFVDSADFSVVIW